MTRTPTVILGCSPNNFLHVIVYVLSKSGLPVPEMLFWDRMQLDEFGSKLTTLGSNFPRVLFAFLP